MADGQIAPANVSGTSGVNASYAANAGVVQNQFVVAAQTQTAQASAANKTPPKSVADQIRGAGSSPQDQAKIVQLLRDELQSDPSQFNATLRELNSDDSLSRMLGRVDNPVQRRELIDILAKGSDDGNATVIRGELTRSDIRLVPIGPVLTPFVKNELWQVRFNAIRLGVPGQGQPFNRTPYAGLVSNDPTAPFTGSGATGVDPTKNSVPITDALWMLGGDQATKAQYSNPIGPLNAYLQGLTPAERADQAKLFLKQPIASPMGEVWGASRPSRAQVIEAAAKKYNLEPSLLAGFLLAEQRDQSALEDAKDYQSAPVHNGSIGLGQIVISTARKDILSDTVSSTTEWAASDGTVGRMLSDDVINIFGAARYLRRVADAGTSFPQSRAPTSLPNFNSAAFAGNSANWPRDNVIALGSEYTSNPWDGKWVMSWGRFVADAQDDVKASGVFSSAGQP